ncbi:MAG: methionyl aminopeptidase [Chlamydiae bacterium]|nr:methionyl aminopeptidase [Chlamydiota bacterium]
MINRNDLCWCHSGKKWKKCHYPQIAEKNININFEYLNKYGILIKTEKQIIGIKNSCKLAAQILDKLCIAAIAGVTTEDLDLYAQKLHKEAGAIAAPLNYGHPPYPKSICTSINDVICHGIPDKTVLKEGDIVNIDVTCILDGYFGDTSKTVAIGKISEEKQNVLTASYEAMMQAIAICKPGIKIYELGDVIEKIAKNHRCSVVNQFVGHGIGIAFHEPPQIPHHHNNMQIPLVPGMTFTIEPMINAGVRDAIIDEKDHWTARTFDGKPSAQNEHTILITPIGHEILTVV